VVGKYYSENPDRIVKDDRGQIQTKELGPLTARILFPHPGSKDEKTISVEPLDQQIPRADLYFELRQPSSDTLELRRVLATGKGIFIQRFDRTKGHFECRDGFIYIKPSTFDEAGIFSRTSPQFTRTSTGALLYYEKREGTRREMIILSSSSVLHYWFRFASAVK
jgi:hypothetical protein